MPQRFSGQVVLITGASEGIGAAAAVAFAKDGAHLVLAARSVDRLAAAAANCTAAQPGTQVLCYPTDVADETAVKALVAAAVERFGGLDVVVANAGMTMWTRLDALEDLGVLERLMRVNYLGAAWLAAAALPHLRRSRGRLVAVASLAGLTGVPERSGYAASKHAMFGFFDSLRIEEAPHGVSVTLIAPDFVVSQIHARAIGADGKALGASPMQRERIMTAETCADALVNATYQRQRMWLGSLRGRLGRWVRLVAPGLVDRLAARAIAQKY
jgi:NAD(P)-dependent dehydrogenase (short-subunit alcohol dehydrogenase family)